MNRTKIEWARNLDGTPGYTWNPITGCLNDCEYCYAKKLAYGRLKSRYLANNNLAPIVGEGATPYNTSRMIDSTDPFYPRFWEEKIKAMVRSNTGRRKPRGVFVCDMSDLFGIGIPEEWTRRVLDVCKGNWQDRFYLLTKQPQNLAEFSPFPDNCWVGVTATDRNMWGNANEYLESVQAKVKYFSFEPLLGSIVGQPNTAFVTEALKIVGINWVIIGAQSKPYKPPKWEWVSEIIDACVKANIPYFLKNNLEAIVPKVFGGEGELRQEMPK